MLIQILITATALSVLTLVWLYVQRLTHVETPSSSGDYLEGRWGCGDCSLTDDCALKTITASGAPASA